MYSTYKSVFVEIFVRSLNNKHVTSISKSMYIDKLVDIVNEYISCNN